MQYVKFSTSNDLPYYSYIASYGTNQPQVKCVLRVPRVCLRVRVHVYLRVARTHV